MARNDIVSDDDELCRWIRKKFVQRDDNGKALLDKSGNIQNVAPQAFALREDEDYLSLTSVNHFHRDKVLGRPAAVEAIRQSLDSKSLALADAFAFGVNRELKQVCLTHRCKVRVLQEPVDGNDGHAAVHRYPPDDSDLQTALTASVFFEAYPYSGIKAWADAPPFSEL